jgi:hypothetical protein
VVLEGKVVGKKGKGEDLEKNILKIFRQGWQWMDAANLRES